VVISDNFKLIYTNYTGWSLLILSITGFGCGLALEKSEVKKTKKLS